ncbi:MAG: FAD-binding oxidoreductase, partial [Chromatiales bacterium]|nr:FAD-binding oxidoreductase [Chromatiales bacterium]
MGPVVEPVESDTHLPARADVVVVGGGIAGVSTALVLAERGVSVVLCEKGHIACEQSSRNWGWVRQMGRDHRELPLIVESMRLWRDMNRRVGADTGFNQCGIVYLAETDADLERHEDFLAHAQPFQIGSRRIDGAAVDAMLPGAARRWAGALYTASDGRAEPQKAVPAMARAAQAAGASVLTECAVRGFETTAGRVSSVVTEKGEIACDSVVVAGGVWSRMLCRRHEVAFPQARIYSTVFRTAPVEGGPEVSAAGSGFAIRKRQDGGYTVTEGGVAVVPIVPDSIRLFFDFLPTMRGQYGQIRLRLGREFFADMYKPWAFDAESPFERTRVLDPPPRAATVTTGLKHLAKAFPVFEGVEVAQTWAGAIDFTPDAVPVISAVDDLPGMHLIAGFSGHGFGIGPGAGKLMADV